MQKDKRICIVGGGPGGLTLARLLHTRGIASTVLEIDAHAQARPQGGSLDLHEASGLRALREAGLIGEFKRVARYDDQGDAIYDHEGTLHFEHKGGDDGQRPEVDRTQLRDILIASLPAESIRWGTKANAIEPLDGGRFRVVCGRELIGDFDLVVGADGAWSKVRPLVSAAKPSYTGVLFIELSIDDVDASHPAIAQLVPNGKVSAVGGGQAIIAQRNSGGHVRVYVMFRVAEDWLRNGGIDLSSAARARADLKKALPGWSPRLLALIDACNDVIVPRPIVELPIGHRWEHRAGVTLIGDAAHVMSPFSGEGVNMAMLDATELALRLDQSADVNEAVRAYESPMFIRAAEEAAGAHEGLSFVSETGLADVLAHFAGSDAAAHGWK